MGQTREGICIPFTLEMDKTVVTTARRGGLDLCSGAGDCKFGGADLRFLPFLKKSGTVRDWRRFAQ